MNNTDLITAARQSVQNGTILSQGVVELLCAALAKSDEQVRLLTEQRDALVVESAQLKEGYRYQIGSIDGDWLNATKADYELIKKQRLSVNDKGHYYDCPAITPETDAVIAGMNADGVESGILAIMIVMNHQHTAVSEAIQVLRTHARQLRESKGGNRG